MTEIQQGGRTFAAIIHLPFGAMGIGTAGAVVTEMFYLPGDTPEQAPANALAEQAARQLLAYCQDADYRFDLPLAMRGSEFQRRVWQTLREIPRGQVRTYGELAKHLDSVARAECCCGPKAHVASRSASDCMRVAPLACCDVETVDLTPPASQQAKDVASLAFVPALIEVPYAPPFAVPSASWRTQPVAHVAAGPPIIRRTCSLLI